LTRNSRVGLTLLVHYLDFYGTSSSFSIINKIPADINSAIQNPAFWSHPAAKRKRFHLDECEFIDMKTLDWWNVRDDESAPEKRIAFWRDPNGTRVDGFDWDGMAVYTDYDLSIAFNDPLDTRFAAPPVEPAYSEDSEESAVEPEQTVDEIKAAQNKVSAVEIDNVVVNHNTRIYKEAEALLELFSKNCGILSTKISTGSIKLESDANVDPSMDFFMIPAIGSIVIALTKAIAFFAAPTATPTKLGVLKSRADDIQSKLRQLQIQHRMNPTDDVAKLESRNNAENLLSDKLTELKTEIALRMASTGSKTVAGVRHEIVTCRRLLKMICKRNSDATKFMEAIRDICKTDMVVAKEEIKHDHAVFHIRACKLSQDESAAIKEKLAAAARKSVDVSASAPAPTDVPVPVPAPVPAPVPVPIVRAPRPAPKAPEKKGPSRSEKLAALRGKK
jgi:hypothetical protein